jgi:hypothetical protein
MLPLRRFEPSRSRGDPSTLMGLERILLYWLSTMAFVTVSSLSLGQLRVESASERIVISAVQYVWIAFAVSGLLFSVWQYVVRQKALAKGITVDSSGLGEGCVLLLVFLRLGCRLGSYFLVAVIVGNLSCVIGLKFWLK